MTPDRASTVRAFFDALNRGDLDEAVEQLDPAFELDWSRSRGPHRGLHRGRDEVQGLYERFLETWTDYEFFETEIFESGDLMVRTGGFRGKGKGSGVETSASAAMVWTFRGDRPVSMCMYQTKAEALEAAGLSG
jgi:ketosteroid isomerase-like protein